MVLTGSGVFVIGYLEYIYKVKREHAGTLQIVMINTCNFAARDIILMVGTSISGHWLLIFFSHLSWISFALPTNAVWRRAAVSYFLCVYFYRKLHIVSV